MPPDLRPAIDPRAKKTKPTEGAEFTYLIVRNFVGYHHVDALPHLVPLVDFVILARRFSTSGGRRATTISPERTNGRFYAVVATFGYVFNRRTAPPV
jgi:hypothetical protein